MKKREQRNFIRYDALHLLDYIVLDENGNHGDYSMGRTIDVSVDGIKLETTSPLIINTQLLITVGLEEDLVDLEGKITHVAPYDDRFVSGIVFIKISKNGRRVFKKYTEAFHRRKVELNEKDSSS